MMPPKLTKVLNGAEEQWRWQSMVDCGEVGHKMDHVTGLYVR